MEYLIYILVALFISISYKYLLFLFDEKDWDDDFIRVMYSIAVTSIGFIFFYSSCITNWTTGDIHWTCNTCFYIWMTMMGTSFNLEIPYTDIFKFFFSIIKIWIDFIKEEWKDEVIR